MGSLSSVFCLGEALIDRLGPPGGDPANDSPVEDCLGGAPANVACGLARLGTAVSFFGRLGEDPIGNRFAALFQQRGVDCGALQWDALRPTRIVLVRRSQDGERQFQGFAGDQGLGFADQALGPVNLPQGSRWLLVGTIPLAATADEGALLFFSSLPYNFYGWFAVLGTLLFALGWLPPVGPMRAAVARVNATGALDAPDARR